MDEYDLLDTAGGAGGGGGGGSTVGSGAAVVKRADPNWNALKSSKTEGTEVATAAEAEDTEVDGGGGVGLIDADELKVRCGSGVVDGGSVDDVEGGAHDLSDANVGGGGSE